MMPNIVLVTIDCLRYDHCGFNGYQAPTTPFLDEVANESYVFDQAYSSGSWTPESFTGILAGLNSYESSFIHDVKWKAIPSDSSTLGTFLKSEGYTTVAQISNANLTVDRNFDLGFDQFENLRISSDKGDGKTDQEDSDTPPINVNQIVEAIRSRARFASRPTPYLLPYIAHRYYHSFTEWPTIDGGKTIEQFLEHFGDDSPVFGWTHLMDVHRPIHPNAARTGDFCSTESTLGLFYDDAKVSSQLESPGYTEAYDGAVRYVDNQIERLVSGLKQQNVWNDTVLIVTSDHGEALFDRGVNGHPPHYLFNELIKVPLLVTIPGRDGGEIDHPFSLSWLHELIADILEVPRKDFPSKSGIPNHLTDPMLEDMNPLVADSLDSAGHTVAVIDPPHKILQHTNAETTLHDWAEHLGTAQTAGWIDVSLSSYFNLKSDKSEHDQKPISEAPDALIDLANKIESNPTEQEELSGMLSENTMEQLAKLGYKE